MKVNISEDERYPFYTMGQRGEYAIELTQAEITMINAANKAFEEAQDCIREKIGAAEGWE